jgi:hypothetical protein
MGSDCFPTAQDTGTDSDGSGGCSAADADYAGIDWGTGQAVCSAGGKCQNGGYAEIGGQRYCVSDSLGDDLPVCDISLVQVGGGGYVCPTPLADTDRDGVPDDFQQDADGDGVPDYQDNDLDGDGVSNVNDPDYVPIAFGDGQGFDGSGIVSAINAQTGALSSKIDGIKNSVNQLNNTNKQGFASVNTNLSNINDTLKDIRQDLKNEEAVSSNLDDTLAPDISVTNERMRLLLVDNPKFAEIFTAPQLSETSVCPTFPLPDTAYWSGLVFDSHCEILDNNVEFIRTLFLFGYGLIAAIVFLRA